ncbi:MAG: DUF362 domain-containing protein, partial [Candidatus Heimdallarchaeota archaeon]|nr:DUF362 domain-containing protein [Candidatus Heimdallarchaeota archaeon]
MKSSNKEHLHNFRNSTIIFGIISLFWLIFRTGTKPSRIVYPCQQSALKGITIGFGSLLPMFTATALWAYFQQVLSYWKAFFIVSILITPLGSGIYLQTTYSYTEVVLQLSSTETTIDFTSDIFVLNGMDVAHITNLIDLMGEHNLSFYQSSTIDTNQGIDGLVASSDVVLIKNNCQWSQRGGTNSDLIKELIEAIIDHPDGFTGEIVIADNGQGRGSMDWSSTNAEDKKLSAKDVANLFNDEYKVSTFLWDNIRSSEVLEYSEGDMNDGYILYPTADPETEIHTSYPKFETDFGTQISFKNGIWNGTGFEQNLKIINFPVLKSHSSFGVTGTLKHYMGVQSQPLANGHDNIDTGGMGTLMIDLGLPTLNIIDAIWVNANPESSLSEGPGTSYSEA